MAPTPRSPRPSRPGSALPRHESRRQGARPITEHPVGRYLPEVNGSPRPASWTLPIVGTRWPAGPADQGAKRRRRRGRLPTPRSARAAPSRSVRVMMLLFPRSTWWAWSCQTPLAEMACPAASTEMPEARATMYMLSSNENPRPRRSAKAASVPPSSVPSSAATMASSSCCACMCTRYGQAGPAPAVRVSGWRSRAGRGSRRGRAAPRKPC